MTAPPVDASFGGLLNSSLRATGWGHRDLNGRRRGGPLDLAGPGRDDAPDPPVWHVLFVSGTGIARSWMAATLLAHYGGRYAYAGFDGPVPEAVPLTVADAMREMDLTPQDEPAVPAGALPRPPDLLITMGLPGTIADPRQGRIRTWNIPDPEGQPIATVRTVRDAIAYRVRMLAAELAIA